jgi:hypothetical protein
MVDTRHRRRAHIVNSEHLPSVRPADGGVSGTNESHVDGHDHAERCPSAAGLVDFIIVAVGNVIDAEPAKSTLVRDGHLRGAPITGPAEYADEFSVMGPGPALPHRGELRLITPSTHRTTSRRVGGLSQTSGEGRRPERHLEEGWIAAACLADRTRQWPRAESTHRRREGLQTRRSSVGPLRQIASSGCDRASFLPGLLASIPLSNRNAFRLNFSD